MDGRCRTLQGTSKAAPSSQLPGPTRKKTLKNGQASMKQQRHGEQTARDKQAGPEWGDEPRTRTSKRQTEASTKNASKLAFNIKLGRGREP